MILTITDNPNITTIKLDVSKCNKENISIYAKRLERYTNNSIYPWYYHKDNPFVLFNTHGAIKNKTGDKIPFDKLVTAFGFIQNAINKYMDRGER